MTTPPPAAAVRAAEKIANSHFRPESVRHYADELTEIITSEFAPMVEALEKAGELIEHLGELYHDIDGEACEVDNETMEFMQPKFEAARKALQLLKETK